MGGKVKKIYLLLIVLLSFGIVSCGEKKSHENLKDLTEYINSLDSYELKAVLSVKRQDKEVNMDITVDYLSPSFYKVSFINEGKDEQIVVKNSSGVYVLTPSLNKEFKFDSDWPLNSSHAYILQTIVNDISKDDMATFTIENDIMQTTAKISKLNSNVTHMKFYYDLVENKPMKTVFLNDNNEEKITVKFNEFIPNKQLKEDVFNNKLIMEEKTSVEGEQSPQLPIFTLTVGYIIEGTTLSSQEVNEDVAVLCYSGDSNYTIVAQTAKTYYTSTSIEEYDDVEVMKYGVILFNEHGARYYYNGLEVSIYSDVLTKVELINIAEELTFE